MRGMVRSIPLVGLCLPLASCGMLGGPCSSVSMDILVDEGLFANTVSARISNDSSSPRRVTIRARDPNGNESTLGPMTVASKSSVTRALGPLMKSYGSTREQLEKNGSTFEITKCE